MTKFVDHLQLRSPHQPLPSVLFFTNGRSGQTDPPTSAIPPYPPASGGGGDGKKSYTLTRILSPLATYNSYFRGVFAGLVSSVCGYPLDVLRVRFLFGTSPTVNLSNGLSFTFIYTALKSGLVWPIQSLIRKWVASLEMNPTIAPFVSGALGNVLPGAVLNPLNVIKVRYMESQEKTNFQSIMKGIRAERSTVFSRGLVATLLRDFMWGMVYFPVFEHLNALLSPSTSLSISSISEKDLVHNTPFINLCVCSATAAATATLLTSSLDGVRLFQMRSLAKGGTPHTFLESLRMALVPTRQYSPTLSILTDKEFLCNCLRSNSSHYNDCYWSFDLSIYQATILMVRRISG